MKLDLLYMHFWQVNRSECSKTSFLYSWRWYYGRQLIYQLPAAVSI